MRCAILVTITHLVVNNINKKSVYEQERERESGEKASHNSNYCLKRGMKKSWSIFYVFVCAYHTE